MDDTTTRIETAHILLNETAIIQDSDVQLCRELSCAIEKEQFHLVFQPIVDIRSGTIISYEALIRWTHPELGVVSPSVFIPLAERNKLIKPIDLWVLKNVLLTETNGVPIHVNMSAHSMSDIAFIGKIKTIIGADHNKLILEFTETSELIFTSDVIAQIRDLGVKLAIDDFGTGYSSLMFLSTLKVNTLKIDISFVRDINRDADCAIITDTIIKLAKSLNIDVIAEGVENTDQLKHLYRNGCTLIQGYLISHPVDKPLLPVDTFKNFQISPKEKYIENTDDFVQKYANGALILVELDSDGCFIRVTENLASYLGYSIGDLKVMNFLDLISMEQRSFFRFVFKKIMVTGYVDNAVVNLIKKDHSLKSTLFSARTESGGGNTIIVYLEDYRFFNEKTNELYGLRNAYSILFNEGPMASIVWNSNNEIVAWNSAATHVFGWTSTEAIGSNITRLVLSPEQFPKYQGYFDAAYHNATATSVLQNISYDGTKIICRWTSQSLKNDVGETVCIISMVTDITKNMETHDHIRLLNAAIDKTGSAVVITNDRREVSFSNPHFAELTGYTDGLLGQSIDILAAQELQNEYYNHLCDTIRIGEIWTGELRHRKSDGSFYWCEVTVVPILNNDTEQFKFIWILNDLTEEKDKRFALEKIQESLLFKERMAMRGALLDSMIIGLNPSLIAADDCIFNIRKLIQKELLLTDTSRTEVDNKLDELIGTISLIKDKLLAYGHLPGENANKAISRFDFVHEVETLLEITKEDYCYTAHTTFQSEEAIWVEGVRTDLQQVVLNLLYNAVESIRIKSPSTPGLIKITLNTVDQSMRFSIDDSGTGISPQYAQRIFEPFFSTHPPGKSSGLGLSISKDIIEKDHHGTLSFTSDLNTGSTFAFEIPLKHHGTA